MPVLCLLLLGVFDLGRLYAEQVAVVSAAREGARAATYLSDEDAVKAIVVTEVNNTVTLNPASDISVVWDSAPQTMMINVTVTYRHRLLFGLFEAWGNGGQLTVSATATMPMVRVFGGTPGPVNTPPPTGTPAPT
jgi:Flp pilus assembly protein TadG